MEEEGERHVRMLAADILRLVNRGGCSKEALEQAKKNLEEAVRSLERKSDGALTLKISS
jgi:hypothetical protein